MFTGASPLAAAYALRVTLNVGYPDPADRSGAPEAGGAR